MRTDWHNVGGNCVLAAGVFVGVGTIASFRNVTR